jgi:uncharacterized protein YxeA
MKKIIVIALAIVILIGGSLYLRNQSSYSAYEGLQQTATTPIVTPSGDNTPTVVETRDERTLEDIALDKRLDEDRKKNEKTYREKGMTGSSLRSTIKRPKLALEDIIAIIETVETYMRDNPDRFAEPADDGTKSRTPDPRMDNLLYGQAKAGIIKGYEDENLVAWEVKKRDGDYTLILLGRKAKGEKWQILSEGDVYQMRKELSDGD